MTKRYIVAAVAAFSFQAVALNTPVMAQTNAAAIGKRTTIFSAEGTKIGRVEKVVDGAVRIIYRGKFLTIPTASLTTQEGGFKTSLTNDDIKKM